jgi:hypothetical protein
MANHFVTAVISAPASRRARFYEPGEALVIVNPSRLAASRFSTYSPI